MSDRKLASIIAIIVIVLLALLGTGWFLLARTYGGSTLSGEKRHDFGIVSITEIPSRFTHTFVLTNTTDETVTIEKVNASCACTTLAIADNELSPGESVEIPATMSLRHSELRKTNVRILLSNGDIETVYLTAEGRSDPRFRTRPHAVVLPDERREQAIDLVLEVYEGTPQAPVFTVTDGFEVEFTGWEQVQSARPLEGRPATYSGRMLVRILGDAMRPSGTVTVEIDGGETHEVPINPSWYDLPGPAAAPAPGSPADTPTADPESN